MTGPPRDVAEVPEAVVSYRNNWSAPFRHRSRLRGACGGRELGFDLTDPSSTISSLPAATRFCEFAGVLNEQLRDRAERAIP